MKVLVSEEKINSSWEKHSLQNTNDKEYVELLVQFDCYTKIENISLENTIKVQAWGCFEPVKIQRHHFQINELDKQVDPSIAALSLNVT